MLLSGVFYLTPEFDIAKAYQIQEGLRSLSYLIKNKPDPSELENTVFVHAMRCYSPSKGELMPYLAKLLTETRVTGKSEVHLEHLDKVVSDQVHRVGKKKDSALGKTIIVSPDAGITPRTEGYNEQYEKMADFALSDIQSFLVFCKALVEGNSQNRHFNPAFKSKARSLYNSYESFIPICKDIYFKYRSDMIRFIQPQPKYENELDSWVEADYVQDRILAKRLLFLNMDGSVCTDPDKTPFIISGAYNNKRIYAVKYRELYDYFVDCIDSLETNPIKFCIGDSYVFRTLGGSYSYINSSLFSQYDAMLMEIITNLCRDLSARYITKGSECLYFLVSPLRDGKEFSKPKVRDIRGVHLSFEYEDITPLA